MTPMQRFFRLIPTPILKKIDQIQQAISPTGTKTLPPSAAGTTHKADAGGGTLAPTYTNRSR